MKIVIPGRDVFARATRTLIDMHTDWDGIHTFFSLHWSDGDLHPGLAAMIVPTINPDRYPAMMLGLARKEIDKGEGVPYAYALQFEGWGVIAPKADASPEERAQFDRDRVGRRFHERADAVEVVQAWCVDIHGRLWSTTKTRSDGQIRETFHGDPDSAPAGRLITGLRECTELAKETRDRG
jgi:hypothetical protein